MRPPRRISIRRFDCGSKAGAMQPGSECKDGSRVPHITWKGSQPSSARVEELSTWYEPCSHRPGS